METENSRTGTAEHTARLANEVIEETKRRGCEERGVGFDGKPLSKRHIYLEGAMECVCKDGPKLELRRMK